ncbi:MAG: hypothetical protein WAL59_02030 [Roseiarcus sp.]
MRRIRRIIAEMLASRETGPPAGFVQLQIARLSGAMIVAPTMRASSTAYRSFAPSQSPAFADAAPSRRITAPRRELPAPNAAPVEAEAKLFLAANP